MKWVRDNLFSGPLNTILTLIGLWIAWEIFPSMIKFYLVDAVWTGADRDACLPEKVGRPVGACWAFVADRWRYFVYGSYPVAERWRVNIVFALFCHRRGLDPVAERALSRPSACCSSSSCCRSWLSRCSMAARSP